MEEKEINNYDINEHELDLIEIAAKLWYNRRFIIKVTIIFAALGLFIAFFTPNEYRASTTMVPQTGDKRPGGSLGGLAAMAGINLGSISSGEVLSPSIYPQILNNVNFQKDLIYSKFNIERAKVPISYFEYRTEDKYSSFNLLTFIKRYTIGLPGIIIRMIKGKPKKEIPIVGVKNDIQELNIDENRTIKELFESLSLNVNEKGGYFTLSFTSNEPKLSAEVVLKAQMLLQKYITDFKLQKVKNNLEFIESSYNDAKINFEEKQAELARFRDRNITLSSATAKTQEEKLKSEYDLLLGVYTELAKQKEQAKIAITETTPILTIIEPIIIPTEKSAPRRALILLGFIFVGFIVGIGSILVNPYLTAIVAKIK